MKSEKGQSLVEFALVLPVLLLLLFGIVDFGRIFHIYLTMDHAGREAARAASIGKTKEEITNTAVRYGESINLDGDNVFISPSGNEVTIKIDYTATLLTPIFGDLIEEIPLSDSTTMRVEE